MKNIIRKTNSINDVCEQSSNVERSRFESFETVRFYTAILTFDVFFIESIDLLADFVSKTVINNKSVEN